jgi:calcineurin-like phosphoesterase family protein
MSDPHFDHESSWAKWKKKDGITPVRPFTSTQEMNETIIINARRIVGKNDILYVLGDLAMTRAGSEYARRLPGRKRLALGNHDGCGARHYLDLGFEDVGAMFDVNISGYRAIMSHIPLHPANVFERWDFNIHGHMHDQSVKREIITGHCAEIDPLYRCVSMEQIGYTPILLEELVKDFPHPPRFSQPTPSQRSASVAL